MNTKQTYWENNGKHQELYERLYEQLVPEIGDAATQEGQLLRYMSNLYYDLYNNGWCNWDVYEEARLFIAYFLIKQNYKRPIKFLMDERDPPENPWKKYGQAMEDLADFIILHVSKKVEELQ